MIWISVQLSLEIEDSEILPASFADHNPVMQEFRNKRQRIMNCRMHSSDLEDKKFIIKFKKEIKTFFQINKTQDVNIQMVWETRKAFLRGLIIQQRIRKAKERNQKYKDLTNRLKKDNWSS